MEVVSILIVCLMLGSVGCCAACKLYTELHKQNNTIHILNV